MQPAIVTNVRHWRPPCGCAKAGLTAGKRADAACPCAPLPGYLERHPQTALPGSDVSGLQPSATAKVARLAAAIVAVKRLVVFRAKGVALRRRRVARGAARATCKRVCRAREHEERAHRHRRGFAGWQPGTAWAHHCETSNLSYTMCHMRVLLSCMARQTCAHSYDSSASSSSSSSSSRSSSLSSSSSSASLIVLYVANLLLIPSSFVGSSAGKSHSVRWNCTSAA